KALSAPERVYRSRFDSLPRQDADESTARRAPVLALKQTCNTPPYGITARAIPTTPTAARARVTIPVTPLAFLFISFLLPHRQLTGVQKTCSALLITSCGPHSTKLPSAAKRIRPTSWIT